MTQFHRNVQACLIIDVNEHHITESMIKISIPTRCRLAPGPTKYFLETYIHSITITHVNRKLYTHLHKQYSTVPIMK